MLPSSHVLKHAIKPLASQSLKRRKSADVMRRRLPAQFGSRKTSTTGAPGREVGGLGEGGGDEGGGGEGEGGDAGAGWARAGAAKATSECILRRSRRTIA